MDRIALQWAIAGSLMGAYGGAPADAWRVAGELAADCPSDPDAAGEFFAQAFSTETAERLLGQPMSF